MKNLRLFTLSILFFTLTVVSAQEVRKYNMYALKFDQLGHIGMDIGTLKTNNVYTGIQGTIPYNNKNKEFYMNCLYGRGTNFLFNSKLIASGILGLYTNDNFDTVNLRTINLGAGLTIIKCGIAFGCSYTYRESFNLKIGFYP